MAKTKKQGMPYFRVSTESLRGVERLTGEEAKELLVAMRDYTEFRQYTFKQETIGLDIMWDRIKPLIDEDYDSYRAEVIRNTYSRFCGIWKNKHPNEKTPSKEEWLRDYYVSDDVNRDQPSPTVTNRDPIPIPIPISISVPISNHTNTENNIIESNADKPQKRRSFAPPTVEEVTEYCRERGNNVSPEYFVDYYTSNGWMVGKNKMKDWKATVRNWERKDDYATAKPAGQDTRGDKAGVSKWNLQSVDLS